MNIVWETAQAIPSMAALSTYSSIVLSAPLHTVGASQWIEAMQLGVTAACVLGAKGP